jgi:hypothetical protein
MQLTRPKHQSNGTATGPSFADLVYAHHDWRTSLNGGEPQAEEEYRRTLKRFQKTHGEVVAAYWCSHIESAVALTEKPRRFSRHARLGFHRETDWATKHAPEIAAELHRLDELAIRARTILSGVRQKICLHLVATCAGHLLSLADAAAAPENRRELNRALAEERERVDEVEKYYSEAANGQAQIVYVAGMATVAVIVSVVGALVLILHRGHFMHREIFLVGVVGLVAGAVGAVVSVIQRITNQSFRVDYDIGRPYAFFLGGLRPMIGAAFAIAITCMFASGILHLPIAAKSGSDQYYWALVVVGFLAGFSERWAQDTLATAVPQKSASEASQPQHD